MFFSGFGNSGRNNKLTNDNIKIGTNNTDNNGTKTPWSDLQNASEMDRRALIEMACEHDRVDILQSVLQIAASTPKNSGDDEDSEEDSSVLHASPTPSSSSRGASSRTFDLSLLNSPPNELLHILTNSNSSSVGRVTEHHTVDEQVMHSKADLITGSASNDQEDTSSFYSDEESSYNSKSREEDAEDEDDDLFTDNQQYQCFVPPLHIAVASGSTHATTALLRMGADPSIQPIFSQHVTGGPMAKFQRCRGGAYELLSSSSPITNTLLSQTVVDQLKHAFTAEALRAIGSDEIHRLQQLLAGGMPPTEKVGDMSLYQWAVELKALQCQQLLLNQQHQLEQEQITVDGIINSTAATTATATASTTLVEQPQAHSTTDSERFSGASEMHETDVNEASSHEAKEKASSDIAARQRQDSIEFLQIQIEEQLNLFVTLSSCLDRFAEESSIYNAVLSTETKTFSKEGLLNKVKQFKASKAQLFAELEFYEVLWKDAQEELNYLENEVSTECYSNVAAAMNHKERDQGSEHIETRHSIEETNDQRTLVLSEDLLKQLSTCQEKVRQVRDDIARLAEENARKQKNIEELGLGGTIQLAKNLLEELFEVEYALSQAKEGEAYCRERIQTLIQQHNLSGSKDVKDDGNSTPVITNDKEKKGYPNEAGGMTDKPFVSAEDQEKDILRGQEETGELDDTDTTNNLVMEYDLPPDELFDKLAGKEKSVSLVDLLTRWVELREMLDDEDVFHDELQEIYSRIPKLHGDDKIDRAGFIALYRGIEDLFEECADNILQPVHDLDQAVEEKRGRQEELKKDEKDSIVTSTSIVSARTPRVDITLWELLRRMVGLGKKVSKHHKLEYRDKGRNVIII